MTLYEAFRKTALIHRDRPALTCGDRTLTYRELLGNVAALARELRERGLGPGGRIALLLPNSLAFAYGFFAPSALGAAVIPIDPTLKSRDLIPILKDSGCSHILTDQNVPDEETRIILESGHPSLPDLKGVLYWSEMKAAVEKGTISADADSETLFPPVSPDAPAAFFYTSGTTGTAKAVVHSHRTMLSSATQGQSFIKRPPIMQVVVLVKLAARYGPRMIRAIFRPPVTMSPAPLHLLLGYGSLIGTLFVGGRFVVNESFHPGKILESIEKERVGFLTLSPTMALALMKSRDFGRRNLSSLWILALTSAPCSPELAFRAERAFRCSVHIAFGATEIGATLQTTAFDPRAKKRGTVGRSLLNNMTRIVDDERREVPRGRVGELAHRLPSVMLGYHNAPDLTASALDGEGWYYTGDLAVMDEQGFVRIVGRKKDMVIRGGQNVFPAEIEQFVLTLDGVKNAAAMGRPDPVLGECLWLYVELQEGATMTAEGLTAICRERLSPAKRPDHVKIVEALPVTASGKVRKFLLKDMDIDHG